MRQRCTITDPPDKYMKRSGSLDLFIYVLGKAPAVQVASDSHDASSSTSCVDAVQQQKQSSGAD